MDPNKAFFIVQIIVQAALLGVVVYLIVKDRRRELPVDVVDDLQQLLEESRRLSEDFSRNIADNADLARQCLKELDLKIEEARKVRSALEEVSVNARKARTYTKDDVVRLFRGGYDPVEISQITGMPVGEVQLMVDLSSRQTDQS